MLCSNLYRPTRCVLLLAIVATLAMITMTGNTLSHAQQTDQADTPPDIGLCFGVYTQWYRFDEAFDASRVHIANAHTQRIENFPAFRIMRHMNVMVLSNVSGQEFTLPQIQRIKQFVAEGGGLVVLGGQNTYGQGYFNDLDLTEIMPVQPLQPFDLKWDRAGAKFEVVREHPILEGIDFSAEPMNYWIHELRPKNGTILLEADGRPLLIVGTHGEGRVAVFTGSPLGEPLAEQTPFWNWEQWPQLLHNIVEWSAGNLDKQQEDQE